jgi:Na+-transporting NADH:ubiquinone oxidoreductase subunit A
MPDHVVKRGLDIPIEGPASGTPEALAAPETVAYCPVEFKGIVPRLSVREGDHVQRGQPLFHAKAAPTVQFLSPVTGTVKEVRRGHRRVITALVVEVDGSSTEEHTFAPLDVASASGDDIRAALQERGQWGAFRTRPLDNIPAADAAPQAILVAATETGPLMPGPDVLLSADDREALQIGLDALRKLCPTVHLTSSGSHPALQGLSGIATHTVTGPHPSGDPAVQVNLICPPSGGGQVWTCRAWDVVEMGRVLQTGRFPNERVYAAVGAGVAKPRFVKTLMGAPLAHVVGEVKPGEQRWIRGSVLTGDAVASDQFVSHFARGVHILPDEVESYLLGWALPMFGTWSFFKAFLKGHTGANDRVDIRPGKFGGDRAMVPIGVYKKVMVTPDVLPEFLFKSIVANDLEEAIDLGLLDMTMEEAALCTFICPSKMEFDELLKQGLELYEREAS